MKKIGALSFAAAFVWNTGSLLAQEPSLEFEVKQVDISCDGKRFVGGVWDILLPTFPELGVLKISYRPNTEKPVLGVSVDEKEWNEHLAGEKGQTLLRQLSTAAIVLKGIGVSECARGAQPKPPDKNQANRRVLKAET